MKAVVISGSRNPEGQTATAANSLIEGLEAEGAQVELHFLPAMDIRLCRQCEDDGWGICRDEGNCIIEDDFAELVAEIKEADVAVFATPVYFGELSESLRAFLDRLRRTCMNPRGNEGIDAKPAAALCVAGGGGGGAPLCTTVMDRIIRTCGFDLVDVIPVRRQNLKMKLPLLEETGRWLSSCPESS